MTGIVMATLSEAKPFITGLSLKQIDTNPFKVFSNDKISLIVSGIGKSNAAVAASYLVWKYRIDHLYNIGAAGSTKREKKIGDIFHIDNVIEYDRPLLANRGERFIKPDLLKGFPIASLATQDRAVIDEQDRERVSIYADLVDMEGASIIQACRLFNVKCYLFKIVSDTPDLKDEYDIVKNIKIIREKMFYYFTENILHKL